MEDWIGEFEHSSITDENREAFNTSMGKYASRDDALVGGYEAMKVAGRNYKLPKSVESLPDEKMRQEFTTEAHKLLGIEHAANVEALADLDMKTGLGKGQEVDEVLGTAFKQFIVDKRVNKATAGDMVAFYNQAMAKAGIAMTAKAEKDKIDAEATAETDKLQAAKTTNEALIAHPDIGSEAKYKELSELFRQAIQNQAGLTAEEYEEFGEELFDLGMNRNPVMARALLKLVAPLAAEGTTIAGKGGTPAAKERTIKDDLPETAKVLDW